MGRRVCCIIKVIERLHFMIHFDNENIEPASDCVVIRIKDKIFSK